MHMNLHWAQGMARSDHELGPTKQREQMPLKQSLLRAKHRASVTQRMLEAHVSEKSSNTRQNCSQEVQAPQRAKISRRDTVDPNADEKTA
jgi:hypothetical protein